MKGETKMLKRMLLLMTLVLILGGLSVVFAEDKKEEVSTTDKDGYILYNFCSTDAKIMMLTGDTSSDSITITKQGATTTFTYQEHILSCGTHMNGTITETKKDGKILIKGDFNVTHNPYKITKLLINLVNEPAAKSTTGTLTIDGRERDVNSLK